MTSPTVFLSDSLVLASVADLGGFCAARYSVDECKYSVKTLLTHGEGIMKYLFIFVLTFHLNAIAEDYTLQVRQIAEGPVTALEKEMLEREAEAQCTAREGFDLQQLITLGKEIWQIVKDGAPVISFASNSASAIPAGAECAFKMSGWSIPQSKTFELAYKNKFGTEMIYFTYKLIYSYGGTFNGRGAYLANVAIHPVDIRLKWGQKFDATVKTAKAINIGTDENPIAGLEISIDWDINTPVMETQSNRTYFVDGLGRVTSL